VDGGLESWGCHPGIGEKYLSSPERPEHIWEKQSFYKKIIVSLSQLYTMYLFVITVIIHSGMERLKLKHSFMFSG
jgi:hypothetical protein